MEIIRKLIFILMTCEILTFGATSYSQKEYKRDIGKLDGGIEGSALGIEKGSDILKLYHNGGKDSFQLLEIFDEDGIKYIKEGNGVRWQDFDDDGISELCITKYRTKTYTGEIVYKWYGGDSGFDYFLFVLNGIFIYIPEYDIFSSLYGRYKDGWKTIERWDGQKLNPIRRVNYKYSEVENAWHYTVENFDLDGEVSSEYTRDLYDADEVAARTMLDGLLYEGLP